MSNGAGTEDTSDQTNSTPSFISALIMGFVILGALLVVWFLLRKKDKRVFQPRTILPPPDLRAHELPDSPIGWLKSVIGAPDTNILEQQGPDAYFFVRFIRLLVFIFAGYFIVTWLILMPINGTGSGGLTGLNRFIIGNIGPDQQARIVAHFLVASVLTLYTLYLLDIEYKHYREVRQSWLGSEKRAGLPSARTVVILNVPKDYMSQEGIQELVGETGNIQQVWLSRQIKDMEDTFDERNKETMILENAEGKVLSLAAKNARKNKLPDPSKSAHIEANDLIARYILKKKQPSHKRGPLGLLGKKVDTLNDSPAYIQSKTEELEKHRANFGELPMGDTAFIRFATRQQAHIFAASVSNGSNGNKKLNHIKSEINVLPEDVVWENLKMSAVQRTGKKVLGWSLTIFLIIIWSIPVALCGFISNINTLTTTVKFLSFLNKLPSVVIGIIQGILPTVLLAVLFMLLPVILRKWVKMQGIVLKSQIELALFSRFWLFQVIHGFLIVTLSSGLINALKDIGNTLPQLPNLLATKLPTASTFFLQYTALYALTSFGMSVSRVVPFVMSKLSVVLSGPTPRKTWKFGDKMNAIALATTWPPVALLMCVAIAYSCIQPIITLFACFTFILLYILYKYVFLWVADQPSSLETGGEYMRKGLLCVLTSLYIELVYLACLFFLKSQPDGSRSKPGLAGGVIMVVMILIVIAFHWTSTHKRYNARECHFLTGTLYGGGHSISSKAAIHDNGSPAYPPQSKEGANSDFGDATPFITEFNENAFQHPATWMDAPVVWIADDSLGIGKAEAARLNELRVPATTDFARMDANGHIDVQRCAPDEAWLGGINKL